MRALLVLLLVGVARAGEEWPGVDERVEQLVQLLSHADPAMRQAAWTELQRIGAPAVDRVLDFIHSADADVRRFVRQFLGRQLRAGDPQLRRHIISVLLSRGKGALGFLPELEAMARRFPGDLGDLARVASMRIGGTRHHVRHLALRADALELLLEFDPERGRVLRAAARHFEKLGGEGKQVEAYLDLLAAASPKADDYLASQLLASIGDLLMVWLDIARYLSRWPPQVGVALAQKLRTESARYLIGVCDALLHGPKDWMRIAKQVRGAYLERVGSETGFTRTHLMLVGARCAGQDPRVLHLLREEARRATPAGIAALCSLRARGEKGLPDPVAQLRGLEGPKRREALGRLVLAGAPECAPLFLDRLATGDGVERRLVLASAAKMPAARMLLPGLAEVMGTGTFDEIGRALSAVARTDKLLEWMGSEPMLLQGLGHGRPEVREKAVYACDDLRKLTPAIVQALERLAEDRAVAAALAWFLPNARRLGSRGTLLVPLLSRIVRRGPPAGLLWGGKSAVRWRRECLQALTEIQPNHQAARAAFREGIASSDRLTRLYALRGFRRLERPEQEDYAAVKQAVEDKDQSVRRAALIVIASPAWREAARPWRK